LKNATISIKNLSLRTIIGINDWERVTKQEILVNIKIDYDATEQVLTDTESPEPNYRSLTKKIIAEVEESQFFLLERLVDHILNLIMEDANVLKASVEVDKPKALRFTDSVSVTMHQSREK